MNPLTNVKNIQKLNERILEMGVEDSLAWHKQYKDSAYVFIGGLPYDLTEGDILCVFSQYGEIVNINLVREKNSGKSKGYCFLCYEDQRSTVLAVDNFNGIKLGGRTIRVDHCANYRRPKSDEKDEQGNRKEIVEAGCAPKTPSPSPSPSEDEDDVLELPKKRKKDKKPKKHKKIKEEKKSQKKKKVLPDDEGHEKTLQKATISDGNAHIKGQGDKTNSPASEKNGRQNNFNTYGYKQVDNMREDISYSAVSQRERDKRDNRPRSQTDSTSERERYRERFEERGASSEHDRANCNRYDDNRKERGTRESPPRKRTDQNHRKRGERDPEHEKRVERSDSSRQRTDRKEGERSRDRRGRSDYENRNDRRRP